MKKTLLLVLMMMGLLMNLSATILTQPASGTGYVGKDLGFRPDCFENCPSDWFWGDGQSRLGDTDNTSFWRFHAYKNPGSYTVHFLRHHIVTPVCATDEYRIVTILENRSIVATPAFAGQNISFSAINFNTPSNITWNMGDGHIYAHKGTSLNHIYLNPGTYAIKVFDWNGDLTTIPVTLVCIVTAAQRSITYLPELPRVDQKVAIQANGFKTANIDWNFGDNAPVQTGSAQIFHRYDSPGTFTITAKEHELNTSPVNRIITILPENRDIIVLSSSEARANEPITVSARNFRGPLVAWDFGDRTPVVSGPFTITHTYNQATNYTISAQDENGESKKVFKAQVKILGINDQVNLEIAEISLDNGKYYKIIPKNSKNIKAKLKMKMLGTGIVSGYWLVDGKPFEFFNETVYQGQIKTIFTKDTPGLPVFDPGMHTITIQLTRPANQTFVIQTLRYFVLPYQNIIEILSPADGSIIKENEIPAFSWQKAVGVSYYQIVFSNQLLRLLQPDSNLVWLDCQEKLNFTPDDTLWKSITRNEWTYWQVRALDSNKNILAESNIQEIKVIIADAAIGIQKITDMDGNHIVIGDIFTATKSSPLLIQGYISYPGEAKYLILQIYANQNLLDQLLFRDVKKDETRIFETSVPNFEKESQIVFQVLQSSSPSVVIGRKEIILKKAE